MIFSETFGLNAISMWDGLQVLSGLLWETDFYTPPVLGGAAFFALAVQRQKSSALWTLNYIHCWR